MDISARIVKLNSINPTSYLIVDKYGVIHAHSANLSALLGRKIVIPVGTLSINDIINVEEDLMGKLSTFLLDKEINEMASKFYL